MGGVIAYFAINFREPNRVTSTPLNKANGKTVKSEDSADEHNIKSFFKGYSTFDSSKSYANRPEKLIQYATKDVLNDTKLFNTEKQLSDKEGAKYVDNTGLESRVDNILIFKLKPNQYQVIVNGQAKYKDSNPGDFTTHYLVTTNAQHKLDSVDYQGKEYVFTDSGTFEKHNDE